MRFQMNRRLAAGQGADADPRTDPGDVLADAMMLVPLTMRNSDAVPGRFVLAAEGTTGQVIQVEVWALSDTGVDRQAGMPEPPTEAERAARQFYHCTPTAPLSVTVGEMLEFPLDADEVMPNPGNVYFRVTTAPAAASVLKVEPAK